MSLTFPPYVVSVHEKIWKVCKKLDLYYKAQSECMFIRDIDCMNRERTAAYRTVHTSKRPYT
jgi:hypothetical protein